MNLSDTDDSIVFENSQSEDSIVLENSQSEDSIVFENSQSEDSIVFENSQNYSEDSIVFENSQSEDSIVFENSQSEDSISKENKIVRFDLSKSSYYSNSREIVSYVRVKKEKNYVDLRENVYKDIFCKLNDGESEAVVSYSDENITCLRDIDENTPKHFVIVSNKKPYTNPQNLGALTKGFLILMKKYKFKEKDYRLMIKSYTNSKKDKTLYLLIDFNN